MLSGKNTSLLIINNNENEIAYTNGCDTRRGERNSLVLLAADGLFNHVTIAGDELEPTCGWVVCIASGIDMTAKLGTQSLQH